MLGMLNFALFFSVLLSKSPYFVCCELCMLFISVGIGVYVNTEIDANRAVSLDFQWLQSDTFITTITECTSISDGEYYLAWVGRSNNSHPKIRFLKVLEG